ncbi:MAG: ATP-binding protein [Candidatus Symbiothrix sp.]|jgi:predicted AAA+ superfamily ATPase|nr:ATP-binding protein [Candidatus Symbiothrix sp.]
MYRTAIKQLIDWKLDNNKKPLIFLGARQVGKTYLIKEFGKKEYRQMVYINFDDKNAPQSMFLQNFDIKRIITELEFYSGLKITPEDTLIVFDEIQSAAQGITSLKYFNENAPEYQIIAAGSLLGINVHGGESFPVGKVNYLQLYPMSFYEFLLAMGEENGLARILAEKHWEYLPPFAKKFKEFLRYYVYIGGMPEAVAVFSQDRDWKKARKIQNEILKNYQNDFSKHAPKEILPRINMVWENIPAQLAKENKKFIYGIIKEGARAKDFELAIQWLVDAGLLHKIYSVTKPALPLVAYQYLSAFKLYHNDVGLLAAMSKLNAKTLLDGDAVFTEFKGALAEQFVYQQLVLNEDLSIHYFPFENSKYELDFLIQTEDDEIIPVEVKSGESLKAHSFKLFCEKYKPQTAIRTSLSDFRQESWMTNVPLYIIGNYLS